MKLRQFHCILTQEIIWRESFKVPHLKHQLSRYFALCLFQGKYVFSFTDHHLFLCWEVVEWEHEAPVEVALSCQGVVMYVCLLFVLFQALYPPMASTQWDTLPSPGEFELKVLSFSNDKQSIIPLTFTNHPVVMLCHANRFHINVPKLA